MTAAYITLACSIAALILWLFRTFHLGFVLVLIGIWLTDLIIPVKDFEGKNN